MRKLSQVKAEKSVCYAQWLESDSIVESVRIEIKHIHVLVYFVSSEIEIIVLISGFSLNTEP